MNFQELTITWEHAVCGMKPQDCTHSTHYHIDDPEAVQQDSKRLKKILDAKYEKANLPKIIEGYSHLNKEQKFIIKVIN